MRARIRPRTVISPPPPEFWPDWLKAVQAAERAAEGLKVERTRRAPQNRGSTRAETSQLASHQLFQRPGDDEVSAPADPVAVRNAIRQARETLRGPKATGPP